MDGPSSKITICFKTYDSELGSHFHYLVKNPILKFFLNEVSANTALEIFIVIKVLKVQNTRVLKSCSNNGEWGSFD